MRKVVLSKPMVSYFVWLIDFIIIGLVGSTICIWYLENPYDYFSYSSIYIKMIIYGGLAFPLFSNVIYKSWRLQNLTKLPAIIGLVWMVILLTITVALFLTKSTEEVSRVWFILWGISCWLALTVERVIVYLFLRWIRIKGYNYRTLLLVGNSSLLEEVKNKISESPWGGLRIIQHISLEQLDDFLINSNKIHIDEVWLCINLSNENQVKSVLFTLRHSVSNIRLIPDLFSYVILNHGFSYVLGIPTIDLSISPVTGKVSLFKNIIDVVLSLIIIIIIIPLLILISLGVFLSSDGPIIFVQKRMGWNGNEIYIYKFRTMYLHEEDNKTLTQAFIGDPRITPFGRYLRQWSLDELPQFINVLQGRMSIVGPRPHAIVHSEFYKDLVPKYMLRHKVKPGITGWAQINGYRGQTDTLKKMEKRIEYDIYYIENLSIIFDLKIIFITIFKLVNSSTKCNFD